jgi:hypothetical protein
MKMLALHGYDDSTTAEPLATSVVDVAPITLSELFMVSVAAGVATWAITRVVDALMTKKTKKRRK